MPIVAAISLTDGQATPVAHTFNPAGPDKNGVLYFADRSGGYPVGYPLVSLSYAEPKGAAPTGLLTTNRVHRAVIKITAPILEVPGNANAAGFVPAPYKAYESLFRGEFVLPERSSLQNRKDILAYARAMLAHAFVTSMVQDNEAVWG